MACETIYEKQLRIAEQCAPVLADVKPANLLMLENSTTEEVKNLTEGSGAMIYFLYRGKRKCAWLIYREEKLERILRKKSNQRFLKKYEYKVFSVNAVLRCLSERAAQYLDGTMPYPHELGIILGYPLEDVEGFIRCEGKNYLLSGYWKVYGDVEAARRTFALYQKVKREAVGKVYGNYSARSCNV